MLLRLLSVAAAGFCVSHAALGQELKPRDAALRVMGASVSVPGSVAYCRSKGWLRDVDLEPVVGWNKKHEGTMRKAIKVIEATGGMSASDREALDKVAFRVVKAQIEDGDPKENCRALISGLRANALDLAVVPELKDALAILDRTP
jgi:hypothetical protein